MITKLAKKLTTKERNALPDEVFALPGRRYPIPDEAHGRVALRYVARYGSPEEKAKVHAAVHKKFPGIGQSES